MSKPQFLAELPSSLSANDRSRFARLAKQRGLTVEGAMSEATRMWLDAQDEKHFFEEIRGKVDWAAFDAVLADRARGESPRRGDELPPGYSREPA